MEYVHLHVQSQYSILNSTISVEEITQLAQKFEMHSVALTDSGNMFGVVDFFKAARTKKIKPIIGCELFLAPASRLEKKKKPGLPTSFSLILLAKNKVGYKNLIQLSSLGYLEGFYYRPRIDKELLSTHSEGLICLWGSLRSSLGFFIQRGEEKKVLEEVEFFQNLFKEDLYFELQRHNIRGDSQQESWLIKKQDDFLRDQSGLEKKLLELASSFNIKYVATNDIHYAQKKDWRAHEILLNIQTGEPCEIWERDSEGEVKRRIPNPKRRVYPSHEFYFKSKQEMAELFPDLPKALETTCEVAEKCSFEFSFKRKHYPLFLLGDENKRITKEERLQQTQEYLYKLCREALPVRYTESLLARLKDKFPSRKPREVVEERLEYEFNIIASKEMCDYFLIVHDFISWAKSQKIPVGPGRGSVVGSLISYLLRITDIEPLQFDLLFERFINPQRFSYPDIDVDICMARRNEVINYLIKKYGKGRVAQIITFGTMKAKMAIRDVGRVMSVSLSKVNRISELVPDEYNMSLEVALDSSSKLREEYQEDPEVRLVIDIAKTIEGSIRNTSIHAAGIIVSADDLMKHVPVCVTKDSDMLVTQFAMKPVEAVGMLKIDFLGLKTLTSIQRTKDEIEKKLGKKLDLSALPLDDKPTFSLLNSGKTLGIFQLESGGMKELIKQLNIDNFEEIVAVLALYRPGPMDMIPSFINRKQRKEVIEIEHPLIEDILKETYGIMVYQEQVIQIASALAGYSLGEGDLLRRAMGKKDRTEMKRQRTKFLEGANALGIAEEVARGIFDKIEKFASYGFNRSHAVAYAYISYLTAYLKANFPAEWMASLLTCDRDDTSKVAKFIGECRALKIAIQPPDINESEMVFIVNKEGIRFSLTAIKGIGTSIVEAIIKERNKRGPFKSLSDFIERVDASKVGKKCVEILIDAGCFDFTLWSRDQLKKNLEEIFDVVLREKKEKAQGVLNLFSLLEDKKKEQLPPKVAQKTTKLEILRKEKELLGVYITSYPFDLYQNKIKNLEVIPIDQVDKDSLFFTYFIIEEIRIKTTVKTQKKFALLRANDGKGIHDVFVWPNLFEQKEELLLENYPIYALVEARKRKDMQFSCLWLEDLNKVDPKKLKAIKATYLNRENRKDTSLQKALLSVIVDVDKMRLSNILELKKIFRKNRGKTPVELCFRGNGRNLSRLVIESKWGISYSEDLKSTLNNVKGVISFELRDSS